MRDLHPIVPTLIILLSVLTAGAWLSGQWRRGPMIELDWGEPDIQLSISEPRVLVGDETWAMRSLPPGLHARGVIVRESRAPEPDGYQYMEWVVFQAAYDARMTELRQSGRGR